MTPITIMDFTGIYETETFYRHEAVRWLDCRRIKGTSCYCDEEAERKLAGLIAPFSPSGIHFIDSGNYHYMTKLWTDKLTAPFDLVLIDHHPDMQPSLFEELLSCGCWVNRTLDTNPFLCKVILLGASDALTASIPAEKKDRVIAFGESAFQSEEVWRNFLLVHAPHPIYLSIDKDVLSPSQVLTNWDQGRFSLKTLNRLLQVLAASGSIIGADICGECPVSIQTALDSRILDQDDQVNQALMNMLRQPVSSLRAAKQPATPACSPDGGREDQIQQDN